jgi:hypothetical protein
MADLALERRMLIDATRKDARGDKIFRVLPWYYVVYEGNHAAVGGLEPVSVNVTGETINSRPDDIQVRGIQFVNEGELYNQMLTGGDVGLTTG